MDDPGVHNSSHDSSSSCYYDGSPSTISSPQSCAVIGDSIAMGIVHRLKGAIFPSGDDDDATSTTESAVLGGMISSGPNGSILAETGYYAVHPPDLNVVLGMTAGTFVGLLFGVAFASVIYRMMSLGRGRSEDGKNGDENDEGGGGSWKRTRPLIRTTLVVSSILLPYAIMTLFGIENSASRFAICSSFVLYFFRTLEATFGYVPTGATRSFGVYAAYFALPFDMSFDSVTDEPIMATKGEMKAGTKRAILDVATIILLCSILSPYDYMPFGSRRAGLDGYGLLGLLHWRHLGDCLVIAFFFQQGLSVSFSLFGNAIQSTLGYRSTPMMRSPIIEATSPSDFWGRRWNVLVHAVMKRGVYKPVRRRTNSALIASLAVFVASGTFHEWLVHACFLYGKSDNRNDVRIGSQTAFFVWNFVVVAIEGVLLRNERFANFGKMVPRWLIPSLIVMTSLPVAHWFGDPYKNGGFFPDYEKCFPIIRKVVTVA